MSGMSGIFWVPTCLYFENLWKSLKLIWSHYSLGFKMALRYWKASTKRTTESRAKREETLEPSCDQTEIRAWKAGPADHVNWCWFPFNLKCIIFRNPWCPVYTCVSVSSLCLRTRSGSATRRSARLTRRPRRQLGKSWKKKGWVSAIFSGWVFRSFQFFAWERNATWINFDPEVTIV